MTTNSSPTTSSLLRDVVREYVRAQRRVASCGDTASTVDCHILTELVRTGPVTQQALADRLMLDKGWISRGVDRLAAAGLVLRAPDPHDRRRVRLQLSAAGQDRAAALDARLDAHAGTVLGNLAPDEERQLAPVLSRLLAHLRAEPLRYRKAQPVDWPAIEALLRAAKLPVDDAAGHLDTFTVGIAGTRLVAVGGFEPHGADVLLRSFATDAQAQGQGHGSALLRHVLAQARATGAGLAYLLTQPATAFFAHHGFAVTDRADAPPAIRATRQFTGLCPASAVLMARPLPLQENVDDH